MCSFESGVWFEKFRKMGVIVQKQLLTRAWCMIVLPRGKRFASGASKYDVILKL